MAKTIDLSKIAYYLIAVLQDGRQIHLEPVAENIAWEENRSELAVRLNLTLRDIEYEGGRLAQILALCTVVYLYADFGDGKKEVFRGTVWEWEHSQTKDDAITLTCYDLLYYLQKSKDDAFYTAGKKTKAIVTDILTSWGVRIGSYGGADVTHEKTLYKNKSVSGMLSDTLDEAHRLGGTKTIIRAREGVVDFVERGSNTEIFVFSADTNIVTAKDRYSMTNLVTRVKVTGKDDSDGRPKVEAVLDGLTEYGILQTIKTRGSSTLDEAKKEAQTILDEKGKPERTIIIQTPDVPTVRKGDKIFIETDGMKGYFVVLGVSHNATAISMQMEVEPA